MKIRYLRYRKFHQLRHGTRTMNWLIAQSQRLAMTAEALFNAMIANSLTFENVEAQERVPPQPPESVSPPVLTGSPIVGQTLSSTAGEWSGTPPISMEIRFIYDNNSETPATEYAPYDANSSKYVVQAGDVGKSITAEVSARGFIGETVASSNSLGPVVSA